MRIALAQMQSGIDPQSNAVAIVQAIGSAAKGGAAMVFTPEMSGLLDRNRARASGHIMTEDQDIVLSEVRRAAAEYGIWVSLGSLALKGGSDGRLVNRSFLIDAAGSVRARYDKIHLFDVDLPTGESWRESAAYAPGKEAVVADTPVGRLGLSICYDLRFPALYAVLSEAGATILSIPAAFTVPTGQAHWHALMRARAIENAAWVVSAAQVGTHEDGRKTYGHSLVVDPWGEVVLDMGEQLGVAFAELEQERCNEVRTQIPVIAHRRAVSDALVVS
ncbi:carbon-nitrogen hydrolase family protein [Aquisediminimonas profunda]|uniref:carbon-nitrogen hydrolase family protein n=1 Tax=Aquisediminimonas profunda TaxID=1550733 RepID=UPI001C62596E|nr:carbon-nitrogen hydrolase family protein [Aquisediminimonas profunda]